MSSTYKNKTYNSVEVNLEEKYIKLPKQKNIKRKGYRNLDNLNGRIINVTVKKEANRYYVSVLIDVVNETSETKSNGIIGLDLGIKNLITTNQGEEYQTKETVEKYKKQIKHEQRNLLRKEKGSKNYIKNKNKMISRLYQKIRNTRKYLLHEISKALTDENKIIAIENLDIKKMIEEKKISKGITNASWGEFIRQLEYK